MSLSLSLLVLKTRELDRVYQFYHSLGIEFVEEQHGKGPVHFAARVGAVVLELYPLPVDGKPPDTTTRLGFSLENVTGLVERLKAVGTPFVSELRMTKWGLQAVVRDPDGRSVELSER